jgi:hypothetical protein
MKHLKKFNLFEKKITIKLANNFNKKVIELIEKYNGVKNTNNTYWFNTKVGKLNLVRFDDNLGSEIYSIFMRFDSAEQAKEITDCNPYSGKWNIHEYDFDVAISEFENRLSSIIK